MHLTGVDCPAEPCLKRPPLATAAVQVNLSGEEQSPSAELSQPLISSWTHYKTAVSGVLPYMSFCGNK